MDKILRALAEPSRKQIIELLRSGPLSVGEISERLNMRQPQVSKHLKVLNDCGIVEIKPIANRRIYQLRSEPFREMAAWAQSFSKLWEARFDRMEAHLETIQANARLEDE